MGSWGEVPMIKDKKKKKKQVITLLWRDRGGRGWRYVLSWKWMVLKKYTKFLEMNGTLKKYTKVKKAGMEVHFILEMHGV